MKQSELPEEEVNRMMEFALYCAFNHPELLTEWGEYKRSKE